MRNLEAMFAALAMLQDPRLARAARKCALPNGITDLLETAAGEAGALSYAAGATGHSEAALNEAAGFFIEQVLLSPKAGSYRVLGGSRDSGEVLLRRHMALLMRWMHPDLVSNGAAGRHFDRSVYARRVTEAWGSIKTARKRAAYDALRDAEKDRTPRPLDGGALPGQIHPAGRGRPDRQTRRQLSIYRLQRESFWDRLFALFEGRG